MRRAHPGAWPGCAPEPTGRSDRCSPANEPGRPHDCECFPGRRAAFERNGRRVWAGSRRDVFESQDPAVALEGSRGHSREPGDPSRLPDVDVRRRRTEHLVARLGVHADADLVGHRSRRDEYRRFLAKKLRRPGLEKRDGRVFTVDVVANLRFGHRTPHRRRRLGHGVGTKIDRRSVHGKSSSRQIIGGRRRPRKNRSILERRSVQCQLSMITTSADQFFGFALARADNSGRKAS